jgi:multiple sugar transport system substrate-binding protein
MTPQSSTSQYLTQHAIAPIKQFMTNSALTPANYDMADIPSGEVGQCTLNGVLYCLPVQLDGGPTLFYNKAMFASAGIMGAPTSWTTVIADAKKLGAAGKAAMCMRGSEAAPNGYPVLLMLPYYLPYAKNYKGEYLDASWKPLFNTPQALVWAKDYQTLMHNYAPKGVAAYDYTDCQHAFQNGQVAMWWDGASLGPNLYNPAMSKVAKSAGFTALNCPAWNQTCILSAPWGVYINPNVDMAHQQAGWQFIAWMTSKKTQQTALLTTKNPDVATRVSTLQTALKNGKALGIPVDYLKALQYGDSHSEPNAIPVTAAFSKLQAQLFVEVSNLITGQDTPSVAVKNLQSKMNAVLLQYGLIQ